MVSASEIQSYTNDTHSEVTESSKHGSFSNDQPEEIKNGKSESADDYFQKDDDASGVSEPEQTEDSEDDSTSNADSDSCSSDSTQENTEGANGISKDTIYYMPFYKAAIHGDWGTAERFLKDDPEALTAMISNSLSILHVAVSTGRSIPFVQKLVDLMPKGSLAMKNDVEDTPLHYAAVAGNAKAAKILVEKDLTLTRLTNKYGSTPLHTAANYGDKETIQYLLTVTQNVDPSPFVGQSGAKLLNRLITADFYDIALDILKGYPMLALEKDNKGDTALLILAKKPKAFPSRSNPTIYEHLLTTFSGAFNKRQNGRTHGDVENPGGSLEEFRKETKLYRFLHSIHNKTLMHHHALQLLRMLSSEALKHGNKKARRLLGPSVRAAARSGIHEFVTEVIKAYPPSARRLDDDDRNIFHLAIIHRQEKVFNLLFQVSSYKCFITEKVDKDGNNMLHMAAKLAPSSRISGAALQMQHELQWFKEVEKIVPHTYKEMRNDEGKTPKMMFKEEHKNLVEQGEKWMKDTASSCGLVAALVLAVVFAANFTTPGGHDQNTGIPIFLDKASFMIFAVANALALFSSSASLLMFLGILTSRYSQEDFLRALPMRLSIGLVTLFFSIVAMLAAFSASLHIVLSHKVSWIGVPIGLAACVPVTLFALLQFPLLVEMVNSTFGPSIFRKQGDDILI